MRAALLDRGLEEAEADALLVVSSSSRDPDIAAFTGPVHLGECFVLSVRGRAPVLGFLVDMERGEAASSGLELAAVSETVLRLRREGLDEAEIWVEVLSRALGEAGLAGRTVALGGSQPAGRVHSVLSALEDRGYHFASGHDLLRRLRKPKSPRELESVRAAASGVRLAFRRVAEILAGAAIRAGELWFEERPLTAGFLRREISHTLSAAGLEQPDGNIVSCGAAAAVPHTRGGDPERLIPGKSIIVDLYPKGDLYADCTRTFCVGPPEEALEAAHRHCREAVELARAGAAPGGSASDLHQQVCRHFEARGHATGNSEPGTREGYVHGLGHGVGYELHELPSFRSEAGAEGLLEPGDVFTLEPGLYSPEKGYGVRLEDLYVMHEGGVENLTPLPYDLDPRSW